MPKWYRYGKSSKLFTCGEHSKAILVEDAASACAVSQVATGIALLGTNMKDADLASLKGYTHIYICLDADATNYNPDATIDDGSCQYEDTAADTYTLSGDYGADMGL